jgi:hypothetical protein
MRYHAKHCVIILAVGLPGIVDEKILELVRQVNRPQSTIDNRPKTDNDEAEEIGWQFDWDTSNYWFRQVEECFGDDRPSVGSIARRWIVEKMDISADKAYWKTDWVQKKYKYDNTSNRQGGLPRVESLRMYAELHARYLAAGELIDSYSASIDKWSNETLWEHYERYSVRGLDPLFPIRLAQPLPTTAANYGAFDKPYEEWVIKDDEDEYLSELWSNDQKDELVIAASFGASSEERDWSVNVDSYLVDPETSASLARLINSQTDALQLPHSHYSVYDYSVGDLPDLLSQWESKNFFEGEVEDDNFRLYGWTYYWSQELPQHDLDERQERYGIGLEVLAPSFVTQNHIQFNPFTLEWYRNNDISIGRSEFWADREGRGKYERFTSGHKLIIASDFLKEYLHDKNLDLLLIVRFSRSRPYGERYREERTYDPGTVRAFIFDAKGEVTLHMEQALIEKGQKLIKEFSDEHATTLQRWMAQHLVGLMKTLDTVENDRDRQALSTQCASLISRLWEIRVEQQTINLQRDLWNVVRLPDEELDLATLSNALQNPPSKEDLKSELWNKLFQLITEVEEWVWRVSMLSTQNSAELEEDSFNDFLRNERAPDLIAKLANVFPNFTGLQISDAEKVHRCVEDAMRQLYVLRHSLIWKSVDSDE